MKAPNPFTMYTRLYADASNLDYTLFSRRFNQVHYKNFTTRISNWKTSNTWEDKDVVGLIYYCYQHNPMHADSLLVYGEMDNIAMSIKSYREWCLQHRQEIEEGGLLATITRYSTDPKYASLSTAMTMDEVYEVYGRH